MFTTAVPKTMQKMSLVGFCTVQRYTEKDHSYPGEFIEEVNNIGTGGESGTKNEQCNHDKCEFCKRKERTRG